MVSSSVSSQVRHNDSSWCWQKSPLADRVGSCDHSALLSLNIKKQIEPKEAREEPLSVPISMS